MKNQNSNTQKAFGVFAIMKEGKIKNIAFSLIENEKSDVFKNLTETHERIGTVHATDLFVNIHKGYCGANNPNGKRYAVHTPGSDFSFKSLAADKHFLFMRVKKSDYDIARDSKGNAICDPITKEPLVVNKSKAVYAEIVSADNKAKIEENLSNYLALPCMLASTDKNLTFTFYGTSGKVFLRPNKSIGLKVEDTKVTTEETVSTEEMVSA